MSAPIAFKNTYYKKEWFKTVPNTKDVPFDVGTCMHEYGKYAVYDGATNFMGFVNENGTFTSNGSLTEYQASFLRSAKETLVGLGLVNNLSGDSI